MTMLGLGWKRDAADPRDWKASAFFGAPMRLPADADLTPWVSRVNDQGPTSTCVFQAITRACTTRLAKIGRPAPELSVLSLYAPVRHKEAGPGVPLEDGGCFPRDAMLAIKAIGLAHDSKWPFDLSKINEDPPWDVFQDASSFHVFEWYRIDASGSSRSTAIAQAISKGYPVPFGMELWQGFMNYSGGVIDRVDPDVVGGHMTCLVGYRTRSDGKREFRLLNSWGLGWGESGYAWVHEDVLANERANDFYAIEIQA